MPFKTDLRVLKKARLMENGKSATSLNHKKRRNRVIRALLIVAGTICVALAAIGIVMPLIPSTPFLLLAAACYCRSSERLYNWLITNKYFGEYIKNYREGKGLTLKTKATAITMLWVTMGISILFFVNILAAQVAMLIVAAAVTAYLLKLPTYKKPCTEPSRQRTKADVVKS